MREGHSEGELSLCSVCHSRLGTHPLLAVQCWASPLAHALTLSYPGRLEGPQLTLQPLHLSENVQTYAINTFSLHVVYFTSCTFHVNTRSYDSSNKEENLTLDPSLPVAKWKFWLIKRSSSKFAVSLE